MKKNIEDASAKDNTVSIAKGIGIILVVIGHAKASILMDFIYMFHMPLFFILSGYCFKEKYLSDFRAFSIRRIKGLYFPFVKWGIFFLILHNVFFYLNIYNDQYGYNGSVSHLYSFQEFLRHGVLGSGLFLYSEQLLGGYWFLVQLFWASILGFIIIKFIKKPILGALILLLGCFVFNYFVNLTIPYTGIGSITLLSASFFVLGHALKNFEFKINIPIMTVCFLAVVVGSFIWNTNMQDFDYRNVFQYTIIAILGSVMILGISRMISERQNSQIGIKLKRFLILAGNNSLTILTWHFICFKIISLIIIAVEGRPIEHLAMFPIIENINFLYKLLYITVGVVIPLMGLFLYNNFITYIKQSRLKTL